MTYRRFLGENPCQDPACECHPRPAMGAVEATDPARTWEQGLFEISIGFTLPWRSATSLMIYQELYRSLTHGQGMSPDDALAILGAAYQAAEADVHG